MGIQVEPSLWLLSRFPLIRRKTQLWIVPLNHLNRQPHSDFELIGPLLRNVDAAFDDLNFAVKLAGTQATRIKEGMYPRPMLRNSPAPRVTIRSAD